MDAAAERRRNLADVLEAVRLTNHAVRMAVDGLARRGADGRRWAAVCDLVERSDDLLGGVERRTKGGEAA